MPRSAVDWARERSEYPSSRGSIWRPARGEGRGFPGGLLIPGLRLVFKRSERFFDGVFLSGEVEQSHDCEHFFHGRVQVREYQASAGVVQRFDDLDEERHP